jgi:cytochrome c biogenesis protein CcdA
MELILGYGAGLLTLINPCVLPVLPIVLATALQSGRHGPLALAAGMSLAFVTLGLAVAASGRALGLTEEVVAQAAALMMIGFGLVLLVPRASSVFATATGGIATRADAGLDRIDRSGLRGQFVGGMLLGAVWSPCVGPTLGGAIALAAQGENLLRAGSVMTAFAAGVSTVVIALAYGARATLMKRQAFMRGLSARAKPIMGVTFVVVGTAILFRVHHMIEAALLDVLPYWLQDLSVSL